MFKRIIAGALLAAASLGAAHAADAIQGVAVSGGAVNVYGIGKSALYVEKTTYSGQNAVAIRYPSGVQTVLDNASGSLYAKAVAAFGANGVAATVPAQRVYDISKVGSVTCFSSGSAIGWPNVAQTDNLTGDGCAFFNAAKAAAQ